MTRVGMVEKMEGTESSHLEHKKKGGVYGEILTQPLSEKLRIKTDNQKI
jgi:hypothetical protein